MTLILALECKNALILASDSQVTFSTSGQPMRASTPKLFQDWNNVAWGGSGDEGVIQRVRMALTEKFPGPNHFRNSTPNDARKLIASATSSAMRALYETQLLSIPGQNFPGAMFLFTGIVRNGSFMIEVGLNGLESDHGTRGFAAIGSGDIFPHFAMASLGHFTVRERVMDEAKALAYRVVDDAINVAAYGLGPPVQMIQISSQEGDAGQARIVTADELLVLGDTVVTWKTLESETLAQCLGISPPEAARQVSPIEAEILA